jgi:adiponectin receptor
MSACFCLGCSAAFHLLNVKSLSFHTFLSRLDYGGISFLIFGSCVPIITYSFACQPAYVERWVWIGIMATLALICFVASLVPSFDTPKWRPVRGIMFMAAGISASAIIISVVGFKRPSVLPIGANIAFYAVGGYSYL